MQRESATYMFMFAALVSVVCAVFVSGAAVGLADKRQLNAALDKQRNVLYAAGLASPEDGLTSDQIIEISEQRIRPVVVDLASGATVSDVDPASYDMEKDAAGPNGLEAPPNSSSIKRISKSAVVYEVRDDRDNIEMVVIPIKGYGLWSTLYGFLALDRDGTTVRGLTYYQHGETPGLGGEVDNPRWKALWPGRKAYNDSWEPALTVIKGQAGPPSSDPYRVDGLSGATITSRGVSNMLQFWLSEDGFGPYLKNFRENG